MIEECFETVEPLLGTKTACVAVGRSRATHYRHQRPGRVTEPKPRPAPKNKLTGAEVEETLATLRSERFCDCSPAQVYFTLLDEGTYLASESTFYRVLRAAGEVRERRRQATHPPRTRPELVARGPNIVWSWDITKLWPRRTFSSDSWCVGVRPAQLHKCRALLNLVMSPISATKIAASTGPTPGMA